MLAVLYGVFLGLWRRVFGGAAENMPILKTRAVQHTIGFVGACIALWCYGYHWIQIIACAAVLQGLFWARSHGCCFTYGHGVEPEERYEQLWYWKYYKKYVPESMLYGYQCDFVLMNIRYTLPAVIMGLILLNIPLMFAGLVLSGVYALMWACYDLGWTSTPTKIAEALSGFLIGVLMVI